MTIGAVFRRAREQSRLSQRTLAAKAGVSSSYVTKLEQDRANPTWETVQRLAAALRFSAVLRLVPTEDAVAESAALMTSSTPIERLREQRVNALAALSWLDEFRVPFVVAGAVAALLQGFPTPVRDLRVLVLDSDEAMEAVQRVLLRQQLLFAERELDELRNAVQRRPWPFDDCEVQITLVPELPPSMSVQLLDDFVVRVLPPSALLDDPEVAAMLRIARVQSSEL